MKIKFSGNRTAFFLVAALWMFTILACSRSAPYQKPLGTPYVITSIPLEQESTPVQGTGAGLIGGGATVFDAPTFIPSETEATLEIPLENTPTEALPSETPFSTPTEESTASSENVPTEKPLITYTTQAGDTIDLLSIRFGVTAEEIISPSEIRRDGMLMPDQLLLIPDRLENITSAVKIMPDSSIVYSPAAIDFDTQAYVKNAGGYLSTYKEWGKNGSRTGADVIDLLSTENSINPMLLLTILDEQSSWVTSTPASFLTMDYPMGYPEFKEKGLYKQVNWTIKELSIGYYQWRAGQLTSITLKDGTTFRLAPELNAGTVAIMYFYAQIMNYDQWQTVLYGDDSILEQYARLFGNPWETAQRIEPIFPANLAQPPLELPFYTGHVWSLTGGPHSAWDEGGAMAALDFAPSSAESGCVDSPEWVTAVADGLIIHSENGMVLLDLDGDGHKETGWVILYLHIATEGRIANGMWVTQGDRIGHPSCEGGNATGTHVHIARKYNGEWILADQQMPFVLSGWQAYAGDAPYEGTLIKGDKIVTASVNGSFDTHISH